MTKKHGTDNIISQATLLPFNALVSLVNRLCGVGLRLAVIKKSKKSPPKPTGKKAEGKQFRQLGGTNALPFRNKVFDDHLAPVHIDVDGSVGAEDNLKASMNFIEQTHWHNSKPLDSKKMPSLTPKELARYHKRNQFYMAEMEKYAESLLGSSGMSQRDIVVAGSPSIKGEKTYSSPQVKARPGTGRPSVREMAAATIQQKVADGERKQRLKWKTQLEAMAKGPQDPMTRIYIAEEYLSKLPKDSRNSLEAEVLAYLLDASFQAINNHEKHKDGTNSITLTYMWGVLTRLMKLRHGVSVDIPEYVRQICQCLGLPVVSLSVHTKQTLSFKPLTIPQKPKNLVGMSGVDFQLMHGGPFMERGIGSLPDPRTPDFEPDLWQREVLDQIDAKMSAFIVAPTSAGKTFISFYAMKQVLKEDNDGILVYVAPTKALVNQIAAEVQARFLKAYPAKMTGRSVWAIHTRDHRINNPNGCQILITVPHILQIMMLSPTNAKLWTPRLKRIIFDEIHSIGQAKEGVIWEQLLLLAPCPIIALSATVGNPDEFYSWLKRAQGVNGHDLKMISHKHRYSDLRNYEYCPPRSFSFKGFSNPSGLYQLGLDLADDMKCMHPVLSLVDRSRGIPNDFSLEPRDCLTLWKALHCLKTENFPVDASLSPSSFFSDTIIGKKDVIEWQESLIELVSNWMKDRNSPFEALLLQLGEDNAGSKTTADAAETSSSSPWPDVPQDDELLSTTLPLICSLHAQRALPALFFNFDRGKCEEICQHLLAQLRKAESAWKLESQAWKAKLSKWSEWKKSQEGAKKKAIKTPKKKRSEDQATSRADEIRDAAFAEGSMWELFDPERPLERFSLADPKKVSQSEFLKYTEDLEWRDIPRWLIDALERGIGVHHAGMNRKYRQVCEILFRRGFLRVVIATGTLALGINMPCKTVVFSGDSLFLTSLNFRQASGRAGRRGFDLLGNVVFQNVPTAKIHRLVSSRLPDLNGHFPVTTSLVLRLFILLHGSDQAPSAVKSINSLL
ncbi:DEAD/DEAH box helicase [Penicillium longicatenatum]|uniref:DEAD/DEAH box helicase n=1 Tax=Penicillium longicatenatum TaxID=1561947 RepID=UPI0025477195|nr:DEAD/DEAH box helicase [Penicillium longicatenatum]KAJ5657229.1 DEAD/DEAH box helicase [Penicillium longicatenatum]